MPKTSTRVLVPVDHSVTVMDVSQSLCGPWLLRRRPSGADASSGQTVEVVAEPEAPTDPGKLEEEVKGEARSLPEHVKPLYVNTAQGIRVPPVRTKLKVMLTQRQGAFA